MMVTIIIKLIIIPILRTKKLRPRTSRRVAVEPECEHKPVSLGPCTLHGIARLRAAGLHGALLKAELASGPGAWGQCQGRSRGYSNYLL